MKSMMKISSAIDMKDLKEREITPMIIFINARERSSLETRNTLKVLKIRALLNALIAFAPLLVERTDSIIEMMTMTPSKRFMRSRA